MRETGVKDGEYQGEKRRPGAARKLTGCVPASASSRATFANQTAQRTDRQQTERGQRANRARTESRQRSDIEPNEKPTDSGQRADRDPPESGLTANRELSADKQQTERRQRADRQPTDSRQTADGERTDSGQRADRQPTENRESAVVRWRNMASRGAVGLRWVLLLICRIAPLGTRGIPAWDPPGSPLDPARDPVAARSEYKSR
ncbi:hypothetical protein Bbelb_155070 [Branchiostoma belcheri]|nr:hypothetical protein Bbelb_155070 [Branchiostoma belcheri]